MVSAPHPVDNTYKTFKSPRCKEIMFVHCSCPHYCLLCAFFIPQIDNEEYGEALSLAQAYNLDSDLVYQRQWRKSTVSIASIQDYLVRDKRKRDGFEEMRKRRWDGYQDREI